jgi:hypothetical protein
MDETPRDVAVVLEPSFASGVADQVLEDVTAGSGANGHPRRSGSPASGSDAGSYSPTTLQRKPIMMKNPLNRAIRPSPP